MVIVPTDPNLATYSQSTELEEIGFGFRFQFNERDDSWFFDLLTAEGEPIRQGIKVVTNWPLLRLVSQLNRPPGELFAIDTTGQNRRAGIDDLGTEILFVYFTAEEMAGSTHPALF